MDPSASLDSSLATGTRNHLSSQPISSASTSIPLTRPSSHTTASAGAVPTQAALQSAGILPADSGHPSTSPSPPSPFTISSAHHPIPASSNSTANETFPALPFSTSVPQLRNSSDGNVQARPLSSDEAKSLSFSQQSQAQFTKSTDQSQDELEKSDYISSIPAEALFPSPSGGFVPPPDVDGQEWKLKEAPRALARGGPIEGESSARKGAEESGNGQGNDAATKEGSQPDRSQTPRGSTVFSSSRESLPPTRPPSLPASSHTAELIATAPSSSTSNSASRRTSQASPSLRPISINSLSLSRSGSDDKRRKSGLSTTSSQLSPTDETWNSKRQSFSLTENQNEESASLDVTSSSSPAETPTSRPTSTSNKSSSSSPTREKVKEAISSDSKTEATERPSSNSSTILGADRSGVASPAKMKAGDLSSRSARDSICSSASNPSDRNEKSDPTSNRQSNLSSILLQPLKIRDFAFPETDPRHVGARDLSLPQERLSTGYGDAYSSSAGQGEDEEEWGPEAHEHSYEDEDEDQEAEVGGLPEGLYQVVYSFDAESEHELSVAQGQKVRVVGALEGGWAIVQTILDQDEIADRDVGQEGSRGLVPEAYLEWIDPDCPV